MHIYTKIQNKYVTVFLILYSLAFLVFMSTIQTSNILLQINMEVNLDLGQISNLKEFVEHLSLRMHSSVPGSLVIWWVLDDKSAIFVLLWIVPKVDFDVFSWSCRYDSVTLDGKLNWQDQLNEHNKPFFDICDGIFVNYTWKVLLIFPWHACATQMFNQ